jgi:small basic protein
MKDPLKIDYATSVPVASKNYRRIASIIAAIAAMLAGIRAINQSQYDPPLAWMILAALAISLLVVAVAFWPKGNRAKISN